MQLGGRAFRVADMLPEQGTADDETIVMHLRDAQALLDKPGKINLILALECRCTVERPAADPQATRARCCPRPRCSATPRRPTRGRSSASW